MKNKDGVISWSSEIKLTHEGYRPVLTASICINGEVMSYRNIASNEDDLYRFIINAIEVFDLRYYKRGN